MHPVGLYTYCRMIHGAYSVKMSCKLQQAWNEQLYVIGRTQETDSPEFSRNTATQQTLIGTADISGIQTAV